MSWRNKYPLVFIEWEDSEQEGSWSNAEEETKHKLGVVGTVGWLIHENEKRVIVAASLSCDSEIGLKQFIPIKMIVRRRTLWKKKDVNARGKRIQKRGSDEAKTPVSS